MAIRFYDEALVNKITAWVRNNQLTILSPNQTKRFFTYVADVTKDKPLELPLISLSRANEIEILNTNKRPLTFDGSMINAEKNIIDNKIVNKSISLNAIPINLQYQIDIYTRYLEEADEYVRNFVFNIINYPRLDINIPYNNLQFIHTSNIRLQSTITDNSDIPERLIAGQFTRFTINIFVDDAYLFSSPIEDNYKIEYEFVE